MIISLLRRKPHDVRIMITKIERRSEMKKKSSKISFLDFLMTMLMIWFDSVSSLILSLRQYFMHSNFDNQFRIHHGIW